MVASTALSHRVPPPVFCHVFRQDSLWKPRPALAGAPSFLHPWLADPASLTARIVTRCRHFQVRVLGESFSLPFRDERSLIDLPSRRVAWVREVLLIADSVPVVFAHSILAPHDLTGAWHMARAIGSRPLGAALFADPRICRGPLLAARLTPTHPLHRHATAAVGSSLPTLWGRRSRFSRLGRPLLVTEVFLPGIENLPE